MVSGRSHTLRLLLPLNNICHQMFRRNSLKSIWDSGEPSCQKSIPSLISNFFASTLTQSYQMAFLHQITNSNKIGCTHCWYHSEFLRPFKLHICHWFFFGQYLGVYMLSGRCFINCCIQGIVLSELTMAPLKAHPMWAISPFWSDSPLFSDTSFPIVEPQFAVPPNYVDHYKTR